MAAAAPPLSVPRVARLARRDPRQSRRLAPRRASHVQVRALRSLLAMERADRRDARGFNAKEASRRRRRKVCPSGVATRTLSRVQPLGGVDSHREARARHSLRKVVARWQRLRLSVPFDDWVEWTEEVKSNRLKISRCVRRIRKATVHRRVGAMDRVYRRVEAAEGARGEGDEVPGATGEPRRGPRVCPVERLCRPRLEARRSAQNRDQVAATAAVGVLQRLGRLGRRGASEPREAQQVPAPHADSQDCRGVCSMGRESRGDETSEARDEARGGVLQAGQRSGAFQGFQTWARERSGGKRHRYLLEKIISRWQRLQLATPFNDWVDWVDQSSGQELQAAPHSSRLPFVTWRDNWAELRRQRHVMSRAERYFRRANAQVLSNAFNTWVESSADAKRHSYSLQKIVTRWQRLQLATPFNDWVDWVEKVKNNRLKLIKAVHRMRTRQDGRGLRDLAR